MRSEIVLRESKNERRVRYYKNAQISIISDNNTPTSTTISYYTIAIPSSDKNDLVDLFLNQLRIMQ
jgi:hypothetical protein